MSETKIEVTVEGITRLTNSRHGNPRWLLRVSADDGSVTANYTTAPDTMDAYKVCDPIVGKQVTLTLLTNSRGTTQIIGIDWEIS